MMRYVSYNVGFWLRETGVALERAAGFFEGSSAHRMPVNRHRRITNLYDKVPSVGSEAFVAPTASVIGDVVVGEKATIWYGAVVKGDAKNVSIGARTNVQDRAVVNAATTIGEDVTVGHSALLDGCSVGDGSLIGMGSKVLAGAVVGKNSMVAAGAVVQTGTAIPDGQLWAGNPASYKRDVRPEEIKYLKSSASHYVNLGQEHIETCRSGCSRSNCVCFPKSS